MDDPRTTRLRHLVVFGSLGGIGLLTGLRVLDYDPSPWGWVVVFSGGAFVLVGPVSWLVRDRVPEERRERMGYIVTGIVLLCLPLALGIGLLTGGLLFFLDVVVLGTIIGFFMASLVERIMIPERVQRPSP